jgi:hypothetical protein
LAVGEQISLKSRGVTSSGFVNLTSFEDAYFVCNGRYYGVIEVKGAEGSILNAILQAAGIGTNLCLQLLSEGLSK